jgi:hypothetical protein
VPAPSPERLFAALAAALLAACGTAEAPPLESSAQERLELGLMTSLPLYWQLGADLSDIVAGNAAAPWQREAMEQRYALVPLDTLSPIAGLTPDLPETDPLAGLTRLAVIQPRGLSPADNVALDDWVRGGGRLLMVLDPQLTGEYELPLGDPRRPSDGALIPPVLARWGLAVAFDEDQAEGRRAVPLGEGFVPVHLAGEVRLREGGADACTLTAQGVAARCRIGAGHVTVFADAALFEDAPNPAARGEAIAALLRFAFAQE